MNFLNIKDLIVTQNKLRCKTKIFDMIEHVKNFGLFDEETIRSFAGGKNLIQIAKFEDDSLYILDGHHRTHACVKAGRNYLFDFEYETTNWYYKDFEEINFKNKWVTPFDPRTEVRLSDLYEFKKKVFSLYESEYIDCIDWIFKNHSLYKTKREIYSVIDL